MTKIKICGLYRPEDIQYINQARPDWCGFIVNFPKSHRSLAPEQVRALRQDLDASITPVGVFVDQPVDTVAALRAAAPGHPVWKAYKVRSPEDLAAANRSTADLIILDNGYGTGETFDWSLVEGVTRPYLLAGGLIPDNIPDAVQRLHPYGLDISSGVETEKQKDFDKIQSAVAAARKD